VFRYVYDSMGRPKNLQENGVNVTSDVAYGPRGEITRLDGGTRTYNALGQVTQMTTPDANGLPVTRTYTYSPTQNNGQITSMVENGESITYQYDALNRLVNASGSGWAQGHEYDGFGNLLRKTGTGAMPFMVDAYTNRLNLAGYGYDANGNLGSMPMAGGTLTMGYDVDNRLATVGYPGSGWGSAGDEFYGYAPDNKRVFKQTKNGPEFYYLWEGSQMLASYQFCGRATAVQWRSRW
jgi:hypothetical protein